MGSPEARSTISETTFRAWISVKTPFLACCDARSISKQTAIASRLFVCLVERVVRVPSGKVKQQKRYLVSLFLINDAI